MAAMCLTALCLHMSVSADENNKLTYLTFSKPTQLPGMTLPAGRYRFELADPVENRKRIAAAVEVARKAECDELPPLLDYVERMIPASGFLVEDRITLADISMASPFATLDHAGTCIDGGRHPKLKAYVDAILARPSFAPATPRCSAAQPSRAARSGSCPSPIRRPPGSSRSGSIRRTTARFSSR